MSEEQHYAPWIIVYEDDNGHQDKGTYLGKSAQNAFDEMIESCKRWAKTDKQKAMYDKYRFVSGKRTSFYD